jgi:hypothetical protein
MKHLTNWGIGFVILGAVLWISVSQSFSAAKIVNLAPPTNIRVEPGENAIAVMWDASPEEATSHFAGYNIYFDTKSSALLSPDRLPYAVQVRKDKHEYVVKGLENGQEYFLHVRSRKFDDSISAAGRPEKAAAPQSEGKKHTVSMFDYDISTATSNSGYGWSRENGQDIPGYHSVMQRVKFIDILMMELPNAKNKSVFISPSEADFTEDWPLRNKTFIADIGTNWVVTDSLADVEFTTSAEIQNGHVYVIKTHDNYYIKLRIESIEEVTLLLPFGQKRRNVNLNKITFTYASQLGQSYEHFLTAKP